MQVAGGESHRGVAMGMAARSMVSESLVGTIPVTGAPMSRKNRAEPAADVAEAGTRAAVTQPAGATSSADDPDVLLMQRVAKDDAAAFEALLLKWQDRLVTLFWHQTGDHSTAEDLAQEVFLRVFRSRKRYQPTARFSTWLYTIANNVASDLRQRAYRRRERGVPNASSASQSMAGLDALAIEKSGQMPARVADRKELLAVVQQALATLGDNQRMAVLLAKFEHCSQEEIATAMGLTVPAVKSLLFRARDNLRTALTPYLEQRPDSEVSHD
jgi:RNA polymerase sigma-70 factor (ECF subfamily)